MKIDYRICRENLGESTDTEAKQYVTSVQRALKQEFPDSEILVSLDSSFATASEILISGYEPDDQNVRELVEEIAHSVWDHGQRTG